LQELKERVERHVGCQFNHVLLNRYRSGQDSMGWHSDDERALGADPVLASLSLGCSRRFLLRPRAALSQSPSLEILLEHGDLLLMGGTLQQRYQHSVPKQGAVRAERINLTFRRVHV
jgi:alkylated DNA repair dioxygenase AlkB